MQNIEKLFEEWVNTKPRDEVYNFHDARNCAIAQFGREMGFSHLVNNPLLIGVPNAMREAVLSVTTTAHKKAVRDFRSVKGTFGDLADELVRQHERARPSFDWSQIEEVKLSEGPHHAPEHGMCVMEMVAWFAGEPHTDQPACACPVLAAFAIETNDNMDDDLRDPMLKPLVPLLVGTNDNEEIKEKRVRSLAASLFRAADVCDWQDVYTGEIAKEIDGNAFVGAACLIASAFAHMAWNAPRGLEPEVWGWAVDALREATKIGRHGGIAEPDIVERHEKLKELVSV